MKTLNQTTTNGIGNMKKEKKYYEKLSLEEAEKQIRELVTKDMQAYEELEELKDRRDKILSPFSYFEVDKLEPEKRKEYVKLVAAIDKNIKDNMHWHSDLYDLTKTIPIPKNKRTCANCFYTLCRKRCDCIQRGIINKVYCNQYVQPRKMESLYYKAHFMTEKERAIETAKTFEDHVNERIQTELETYKGTLKQLEEYLKEVEVEETTIAPKDILDKFEREEKQIKESMKAWSACYDHKRIKKGIFKCGYVWTPNKKKFKKLAEKNAKAKKKMMCPMQAFAASVGLTKVDDSE